MSTEMYDQKYVLERTGQTKWTDENDWPESVHMPVC